jgi:hypothetical protein
LIILIILAEEYKLWSSSLCSFLQFPVTSSLFGPNKHRDKFILSGWWSPALCKVDRWLHFWAKWLDYIVSVYSEHPIVLPTQTWVSWKKGFFFSFLTATWPAGLRNTMQQANSKPWLCFVSLKLSACLQTWPTLQTKLVQHSVHL